MEMRKTLYRFFGNFEKEEAWLNQMASQGLHCVDYVLCRYKFEQGAPSEYIYRIELMEKDPRSPEGMAYLEFLEEAGIEVVATHVRWVYLRKKAEQGPFDLYSDNASRIKHYRRILRLLLPIGGLNFFLGIGILHNWQPINLLNLGASFLLAIPAWSYYQRIMQLEKESEIRE